MSKRIVAITSKLLDGNILARPNVTLKIKYTLPSIQTGNQRAGFHSSRQKHRTKNANISFSNEYGSFKNSNSCFTKIGSTRKFSSSTDEAFRRFRSFANGEQFTKVFVDSALSYTVSVAYSPKDRLKNNGSADDGVYDDGEFVQNFKLLNAKNVYESPTGEDNYILAYTEIGIVVGVLDGVGGWAEQGYDSSAISRELANKITKIYLESPKLTPMEILSLAYEQVKEEGIVKVGSTTVCFGIIDGNNGRLSTLNLGDSWFGVFRKDENEKYKCIQQSSEQVHYFNAPYQLSVIPQDFLDAAKKRGTAYLMNEPDECDNYESKLRSGDIVVFTTDGMVDNILPEDIELYLNDNVNDGVNLNESLGSLNKNLVQQTTVLSLNTNYKSVFSQKLTSLTNQDYIGGKPDDITSVMVYVK
ncbi:Protein phosphatase 2C 7, mitochondrial [Pichia kudriavzevii]|uniref:Protein phosphatase n=1 Tax=Pichia kudriavzevii TaxID=4909 RepID=A0A1V2LSB8_PICKU|nr:Protein phosphatase 2C 7, mitochondrial [Pichia kudriavzevii]